MTGTRMRFGIVGLVLFIINIILVGGCATTPPGKIGELVWPDPPEEPRVRYVESLSSRRDVMGPPSFFDRLLGEETGEALAKPYGVLADKAGRVYVADSGQGVVFVFDKKNKKLDLVGIRAGVGKLAQPTGLALNSEGILFVSDTKLDRVFGYDEKGEVVVAIGKKGEFYNPAGIAIDAASDRLYVPDPGRHVIRVYDSRDGHFVFSIGERGSGEGQFNFPTNAFVRHSKLYVSDSGNFRIQIFDLDGKFLKAFGGIGDAPGRFARPKGIAVDSEGHIYVIDAAFDNFQIFDEDGKLLMFVGGAGASPGRFNLPAGMYIDEEDRIYVADQYNFRVQVFQFLGQQYKAKQAPEGKAPGPP
ncbi:MAG: 6-bladed beta-propeller [Candidatus Methylomirabilales bacterium]